MATKMLMPLLGQTMEEGTIVKWFKNVGDTVKEGEPLLEVLTDKVNMEVEAPESGVLRKVYGQVDDIIPVKDPVCIIAGADESIDDLLKDDAPAQSNAEPAKQEPVMEAPTATVAPAAVSTPSTTDGKIFASPAAKRVAKEKGLDIAALAGRGTGPGGRIVENDVLNFIASAPKATPLAGKMASDMGLSIGAVSGTGVGGKVTSEDVLRAGAPAPVAMPAMSAPVIGGTIPYAGMRKAVGQNVAASKQTAPHVTLVTEVDMTECVCLRNQILADVEKNYGVRISYTDIIVKAVARAIYDKPIVNSTLKDDQIIIHDRVNIGVATAIEAGLVVPVIKDVATKTVPQISKEIKELAARARAGQAGGADFQGGTFSISNLGAYGITTFNPIISPGQSAILGVCAIVDKPMVMEGDIEVRSMMNLCLSFDHRVMDGAPAAEFLARLKQILETPYLIFM